MPKSPTRYTYYKCDGFEVWGKEYKDTAGMVTWRLRVFAEQDRRTETYDNLLATGPEGKRAGESRAMRDALEAWAQPAGELGETLSRSPTEKLKLTAEEVNSLPPRAKAYLQDLERQVSDLHDSVEQMKRSILALKKGRPV